MAQARPPASPDSLAAAEAARLGLRLDRRSVWLRRSDAARLVRRAHRKSLRLGTAIMQMSARTPAATAMAAMTLDHLSGGRVILGLGASGPQVVEGWYGQPYPRPLDRTREMWRSSGASSPARNPSSFTASTTTCRSRRDGSRQGAQVDDPSAAPDIPIFIAAEGPKNVALAAEIADGWLPLFFAPKQDEFYREASLRGSRRAASPGTAERFEVTQSMVTIIVSDDVEGRGELRAADPRAVRRRHGREGRELPLRRARASRLRIRFYARPAALPQRPEARSNRRHHPEEMVEDVALVGPPEKIRDELAVWKDTCITTFLVSGPLARATPSVV